MANSWPTGRTEVECSDLYINIDFHPRRSTDSPRPSCNSPPDAKRQDRDPPDPKSTTVVSDVYPLQTRMRHILKWLDKESSGPPEVDEGSERRGVFGLPKTRRRSA